MFLTLVAALLSAAWGGPAVRLIPSAASDSTAILATVSAFHAALAAGDSGAALAWLAPDAIILESGELETRADYAAHHLGADMEFSRAVKSLPVTTLLSHGGGRMGRGHHDGPRDIPGSPDRLTRC